MHRISSAILMLSITASLQATAGDIVYMQCKGLLTTCGVRGNGSKACDKPEGTLYAIEWNNTSIKHLDSFGTLQFTEKCHVGETVIQCSEESDGEKHEFSRFGRNSRSLVLERATGRVGLTSTSELVGKNTMLSMGFTQYFVRYEGLCTPRTDKNLF